MIKSNRLMYWLGAFTILYYITKLRRMLQVNNNNNNDNNIPIKSSYKELWHQMFWESKWVGSKSYAVIEKYFQEKMKAAENTTF